MALTQVLSNPTQYLPVGLLIPSNLQPLPIIPIRSTTFSKLCVLVADLFLASKQVQIANKKITRLGSILRAKPNIMFRGTTPPAIPFRLAQALNLTCKFIVSPMVISIDTTIERVLHDMNRRASHSNTPMPEWSLPPYLMGKSTVKFLNTHLPSSFYNSISRIHANFVSPVVNQNSPVVPHKPKDFIIKLSDKNLGLVAMTKNDYHFWMMDILQDTNYYRHIPFSAPIPQSTPYKQQLLQAAINLRGLLTRHGFQSKSGAVNIMGLTYDKLLARSFSLKQSPWSTLLIPIFDQLLSTELPPPPAIYGLPKIHKPVPALRPITALHSYPTYLLGKYIADELNFLLGLCPRVALSTPDLVAKLQLLDNIPTTAYIISLDVTSLYPNLDTDLNVSALKQFLPNFFQRYINSLPPSVRALQFIEGQKRILLLLDLLQWAFSMSYFQYDEQLYIQIFGSSMGNPASPPFAQLALFLMEEEVLHSYASNLVFYNRYLDDIFAIFAGSLTQAQEFLAALNDRQDRIKFTGTITPCSNPSAFLDLTIWVDKGKALFKPYSKPISRFLYIPFESDHPRASLRGFIIGEAIRLAVNSSLELFWRDAVLEFWLRLLDRGYPSTFIVEALNQVTYDSRAKTLDKYLVRATTSLFSQQEIYKLQVPKAPASQKQDFFNVYGPHRAKSLIFPQIKEAIAEVTLRSHKVASLANTPIRYVVTNPPNVGRFLIKASQSGRVEEV